MASSHNPLFVGLLVVNVLVLIAVYALNGISSTGSPPFHTTQRNQSDKYSLEITPAGWTFTIWAFIYVWQAGWVLYSIVNIFRRTAEGKPVYLSPEILTPLLFVCYILANFGNIVWLFTFDRDYIQVAFVSLFLIAVFLVAGLAVSYRSLDKSSAELAAQGRAKDIWLVRVLVHNGLGIYATWTAIASLLNMAMVITYSSGSPVSMPTACTVALAVLSAEIAAFASADLLLLDRYSRYTLTPYAVVIVALVGSVDKNYVAGATNSVFLAVLLALASLLFVVKVALSVYRHLTRPPYPSVVTPTLIDSQSKNLP